MGRMEPTADQTGEWAVGRSSTFFSWKKSSFPSLTITKVQFSSLNYKTGYLAFLNYQNHLFYLPRRFHKWFFRNFSFLSHFLLNWTIYRVGFFVLFSITMPIFIIFEPHLLPQLSEKWEKGKKLLKKYKNCLENCWGR